MIYASATRDKQTQRLMSVRTGNRGEGRAESGARGGKGVDSGHTIRQLTGFIPKVRQLQYFQENSRQICATFGKNKIIK